MRQITTADLRRQTVRYWAGFTHARGEVDVARVHAFQALVRENPDTHDFSDDQITEAYGGRGWAPVPVCVECGARDDSNVLFGPEPAVPVCQACIAAAAALNATPGRKTNLFTRFFGA